MWKETSHFQLENSRFWCTTPSRDVVCQQRLRQGKAAVDHFTRMVAIELAPLGVRCNTVSPGLTVSTFHKRLIGYSADAYNSWIENTEKNIPIGKACEGDDLARMIVFLASENSRLVTGINIQVDGGMQFVGVGSIFKDQAKL